MNNRSFRERLFWFLLEELDFVLILLKKYDIIDIATNHHHFI